MRAPHRLIEDILRPFEQAVCDAYEDAVGAVVELIEDDVFCYHHHRRSPPMTFAFKTRQRKTLQLGVVQTDGTPASPFPADATFESSDESAFTIDVAGPGADQVVVHAKSTVGTFTLMAIGTNKDGATISTPFTIEISAREASPDAAIGFTASVIPGTEADE